MITRRSIIAGIAAALVAPAVVRASSLMPVRSIARLITPPSQLIQPEWKWLYPHGQLVARADFPELFNAIGNTYGGGRDTFRLPDLRGRPDFKPWPFGVLIALRNLDGVPAGTLVTVFPSKKGIIEVPDDASDLVG